MLRRAAFAILLAAAPAAARESSAAILTNAVVAYRAGHYASARPALKSLADGGSAIAETLLGVMAAKGLDRPADPATAAALWLRAANRGYAPAQLALAKALAKGEGVNADRGAAWVWAKLAATGDDAALSAAAADYAASLEPALGTARLAELELDRAAWRPWAR